MCSMFVALRLPWRWKKWLSVVFYLCFLYFIFHAKVPGWCPGVNISQMNGHIRGKTPIRLSDMTEIQVNIRRAL